MATEATGGGAAARRQPLGNCACAAQKDQASVGTRPGGPKSSTEGETTLGGMVCPSSHNDWHSWCAALES